MLTKKVVVFHRSSQCEDSFQKLKDLLTCEPVLQLADWKKEFVLTTDASNYVSGVVLEQEHDRKQLPVAYASRKLKKSEVRYSTIQKEAFVCVFGVEHFNYYLMGNKFTLITDHAPLRS